MIKERDKCNVCGGRGWIDTVMGIHKCPVCGYKGAVWYFGKRQGGVYLWMSQKVGLES